MYKATIFLLSAIVIFSFTQCSSPAAEKYLQNEKKRAEVISTLLSNHEYTAQLMDSIMNNNHSIISMRENHDMMRMIISGNGMMNMMMTDTSMKNMMMNNLMEIMKNDTSASKHMMEMMMGNPQMKSMMQGHENE